MDKNILLLFSDEPPKDEKINSITIITNITIIPPLLLLDILKDVVSMVDVGNVSMIYILRQVFFSIEKAICFICL